MPEIQVVGGGPAGSAAAIAALSEGAAVHILERARAPRHKVCGEFIPAEACAVLDALGVWQDFLSRSPAKLHRCILHFGSQSKTWRLSEPAFSLSRFELDRLLLDRAVALGASLSRGETYSERNAPPRNAVVLANGRRAGGGNSGRLFGFKAHFAGPVTDAVELYFTPYGYVGISGVENNLTNICGLAREDTLRRFDFDTGALLSSDPVVAERLKPLTRRIPWIKVGPLVFSGIGGSARGDERVYRAGDALGFIDPFTGSGILNALLTGRLAGFAAARQIPSATHLLTCQKLLRRPFAISAVFRALLAARMSRLAFLIPGDWLYRMTRARTGIEKLRLTGA